MVERLVVVMVVCLVGVAHAGEPPQAVDADGVPVHPPGATQPLPPGATAPLPEPDVDDSKTPPLSAGRIAGEVFIGGLFEVGGAIAGGYIGYGIETADGCHGEWCGLGGVAIGGLVGAAAAAPVGVYLIGNTDGQTGSFAATLGGSALATLAGLGAFAVTDWNEVGGALFIASPVVGAVIGFNATRRYERRPRAQRTWAPVASSAHGTTSFGLVGSF